MFPHILRHTQQKNAGCDNIHIYVYMYIYVPFNVYDIPQHAAECLLLHTHTHENNVLYRMPCAVLRVL